METLYYFTLKGAKQVIDIYSHLIGNNYLFNVNQISTKKLLSIDSYVADIQGETAYVVFKFEDENYLSIFEFMSLNTMISYDFKLFENIGIQI